MKSLTPAHIDLVGTVMDMQLQRQNVIMGNIANVNTPQFRPLDLDFESALQQAMNLDARGKMSRTQSGHMPSVFNPDTFSPSWSAELKPSVVHGEDRVNLEKEMVKMAQNNLQYTALSQITKNTFDGIRQVIAESVKV